MLLNTLLGTEFPFIQGGMANIATGEFAAAVSNAGGLGLIGAGGMDVEQLAAHIRTCKQLTEKPFGVNIMLMHPQAAEMAALVAAERVPVVTTGAGNPGQYMASWKAAGCKVFPVVPAVVLAKRLASQGADAIIAEGTESGGHVGELTTMALVPQVVDAVDLPVIAAGGIAVSYTHLYRRDIAFRPIGGCYEYGGFSAFVAASSFTADIYQAVLCKDASEKQMSFISRMTVVIIAIAAFILAALPGSGSIMDLVENAWAGFGAAFGPVILLSLYWKRLTYRGAVAGILSGGVTVVLWILFLSKPTGIYEILPGFLVCLVVAWAVSLLTPQPDQQVQELFDTAFQTDLEE